VANPIERLTAATAHRRDGQEA